MIWALVSSGGFVLATALVIALARGRTAEWEREHAEDDELGLLVRRREGGG